MKSILEMVSVTTPPTKLRLSSAMVLSLAAQKLSPVKTCTTVHMRVMAMMSAAKQQMTALAMMPAGLRHQHLALAFSLIHSTMAETVAPTVSEPPEVVSAVLSQKSEGYLGTFSVFWKYHVPMEPETTMRRICASMPVTHRKWKMMKRTPIVAVPESSTPHCLVVGSGV